MRRVGILAGLVAILAAGCGQEGAEGVKTADTAAVRKAFEGYRDALRMQKTAAAVAALDSGSIASYGRMRDLALRGDEKTVRALPVLEQALVLGLRHRVPIDTLRAFTPAQVVAYTLQPGWMPETAIQQEMMLGRIEIDGDEATGEASVAGATTGQRFRFVRENDLWKIDMASIAREVSQRLESMMGAEPEREKIIRAMLERATGKSLSKTLWIPPLSADSAGADSIRARGRGE